MINIKKYIIISASLLLFISINVTGQLISSNPTFPQDNQVVTITFNSELGSGGLANYAGDIYAHTGVITQNSVSLGDWKYVKTNWGVNTPETKLTKIGNNLYTLNISPNIRAYYGVPINEKILQIALVFRSDVAVGGSYLEGKTETGSDIYVNVYDNGLNISLSRPNAGYVFINLNDSLPISINSINADSIFLYVNDQIIKADSGNQIIDTLIANSYGKTWVKGSAKDTIQTVADSFYYYVRENPSIEALPAGTVEGINYIDSTTVTLCLFAPFKSYAYVLGDFNLWELDSLYYMKKTPDGNHFWLTIHNLIPGKEYIFQYLVDGNINIGDPYAEKVSDPWNDSYIDAATYPNMLSYPAGKTSGIATVLQTNQKQYLWKNQSYQVPKSEDLVVYELLVRDFTAKHTFQGVIDSLSYLVDLGINAIELMPINEFEGNNSWGYNPNYYFAVDKYYGTKDDFKKLVDTCHALGIAIILDIVYNHSFGTSPYVLLWWDEQLDQPAANNPFFNTVAKHDYNVGFDMNHESAATRKYISRALTFWTQEYRIDGFRFDLSKGFTQKNTLGSVGAWGQYDATRIYTLNRYADSVWAYNPNAYVILEHFADNSEEKELSSRGMMLWGNMNGSYAEGAMGYNTSSKSDFSWISYQNRGWAMPNVVGYMESHDEERLMYKCSQWGATAPDYDITEVPTYLQRASLDAMFFLTIPGPKMIWQFGELGYDISIDFNGRTGEKPIRWDYYTSDDRRNNYMIYKAINQLRKEESACFQTTDFTLNVANGQKNIILRDTSMNAVIVGNFDIASVDYTVNFPHDGQWFDYLSGETITVSNQIFAFNLDAGEYHLLTDKQKTVPEIVITPKNILKDKLNFEGYLEISPNPSTGNINFFINSFETATIQIFDMNGRSLGSFSVNGEGRRVITLTDLNLVLNSGIYFCELIGLNQREIRKFIIL